MCVIDRPKNWLAAGGDSRCGDGGARRTACLAYVHGPLHRGRHVWGRTGTNSIFGGAGLALAATQGISKVAAAQAGASRLSARTCWVGGRKRLAWLERAGAARAPVLAARALESSRAEAEGILRIPSQILCCFRAYSGSDFALRPARSGANSSRSQHIQPGAGNCLASRALSPAGVRSRPTEGTLSLSVGARELSNRSKEAASLTQS